MNNQRKLNTVSWNWRRIRKNLNATSKSIWFYFELVGGEVLIGFGSNNHYCMHVCMFYVCTYQVEAKAITCQTSFELPSANWCHNWARSHMGSEGKQKLGHITDTFQTSKQSFPRQKLRIFYLYTILIVLFTVYLACYANGLKWNRTLI